MPQRFSPYWDVTLAELLQMRLGPSVDMDGVLQQHGLQAFANRRWHSLSGRAGALPAGHRAGHGPAGAAGR
jgi:iron complex transport system ATP-binding protein